MARRPVGKLQQDEIRRGDVWWVDFYPARGSESQKRRPAVVVSADPLNRIRRTVVVLPLSTGPMPHPPLVIAVPSAGATTKAVCDQLRAVDRSRLMSRAGHMSSADIQAIEVALRQVLRL